MRFLLLLLATCIPAFGQRTVMARPDGTLQSPTNFFYTNVIAGSGITLVPTFSNITITASVPTSGITNIQSADGIALGTNSGIIYITNLVAYITNHFQPSSLGLTNWSQIGTNSLTTKLESNVWQLSWGALSTNALTSKLDSNVWNNSWGALSTNALTAKLDSNVWQLSWGALSTNALTGKLDSNVWQNSWGALSTNSLTSKLDSNVWQLSWGGLSTNALTGKLDSNVWAASWGALGTNALTDKLDSNVWQSSWGAISTNALTTKLESNANLGDWSLYSTNVILQTATNGVTVAAGANITVTTNGNASGFVYTIDGTAGGSSYLFNTNQFATNTSFNVDIKKAARFTNTILRAATNLASLTFPDEAPIIYPGFSIGSLTPLGDTMAVFGNLDTRNLNATETTLWDLTVKTNLFLPISAVSVGQIWTLTNATTGSGSWSNQLDAGTFQPAAALLSNLVSNPYTGYTNQVFGGTNTSVRTAGGTNFIDTTGNLNNWSQIPTGAMANVVSTDFLTNWANSISNLTQTKQNGAALLTNLVNNPYTGYTNQFATNWYSFQSTDQEGFPTIVLLSTNAYFNQSIATFIQNDITNEFADLGAVVSIGNQNMNTNPSALAVTNRDVFAIGNRVFDNATVTKSSHLYGIGQADYQSASIDISGALYSFGNSGASSSTLQKVTNVAVIGENNLNGAIVTNANSIYALGRFAFSNAKITNSTKLFSFGDSSLGAAFVSNTFNVYGMGLNNMNAAKLLNSQSIYSFGNSGLSSSPLTNALNIYVIGNNAMAISTNLSVNDIYVIGDRGMNHNLMTNCFDIYCIGGVQGTMLSNSAALVFIGATAGTNSSGEFTNVVFIGNDSVARTNTAQDRVVFGTNMTLMIHGVNLNFPPTNGLAGQILTMVDTAGNLSWSNAPASSGGSLTTNANQFGASVQLTIKDGALLTNASLYGTSTTANTNFTVLGTNDVRYLKLSGGVAGGSILRTDSNTNVVAATISTGLSFDGTTLTTSFSGLATNANQFGANTTLTIKDGALVTNVISFTSFNPQTNNAANATVTNQIFYVREDLKSAVAFRTNQIDLSTQTWKQFTNSLQTNIICQITNQNLAIGGSCIIDIYGAGIMGGTVTNAWQVAFTTLGSGTNIFWPTGATNGNYDVLVNSNQVVTVTLRASRSTNIIASYKAFE